ncbi:peroxidasin isoform X2 [Venturia canescens]|nr:peroxidasin isoform X2 [Venturia canescens]XP_043287208.1 peroxidasin isoform X2 [Venturia canescens]
MTRLRLDSNALVCDCDLVWLVERLREKPPRETTAVCESPPEMRGRSLDAMTSFDFHCEVPRITEGPEDVEARIGETAEFSCRVAGNPKPRIKWMKNSEELVNADENKEKRYALREEGTILVINEIRESDQGEYECIAESKMGTSVSRKARAIVTFAGPSIRFTEIPESRSVKSGERVSLYCKADGRPIPELQWWRNGIRIIGSTGGRFKLINDEDNGSKLVISDTKVGDSARYVCQARNINGYGEVSADIRVSEGDTSAPRLTYEPPDYLEAEPGSSVEIPCRGDGKPRPAIKWKKDGSALLGAEQEEAAGGGIGGIGGINGNNEKYKISRAGSLYIFNVSTSEGGRYECTASNAYGRASAQTLLKIRQIFGTRDILVMRAFQDAEASIDRAINETIASLFGERGGGAAAEGGKPPFDPFKLARYPNAAARAAARPAEIFERTLVNIRRYVERGIPASNVNSSFDYREALSTEEVAEIERLSGCTGHRTGARPLNCGNVCHHGKYRSIDGSCNNREHQTWGSSYTAFRRILPAIYENGLSQPVGWQKGRLYYGFPKPAARLVSSNLISTDTITSDDSITHMTMQWGQFLDHDLDHALPSISSESWDGIDCKKSCDNAAPCFPMEVPPGDSRITNRRCIDFVRTSAVCGSGITSVLWGEGLAPREQMNQLTSYLDASQVYGYNDELARDLRQIGIPGVIEDRGLLREGPALPGRKPMLPYALPGQFVDCRRNHLESSINCFLAGDIRANEQVGLLAMHTLWLREHNRIARHLARANPLWKGEKIYQEARKIVGAEMQVITYEHWLPRIFGRSVVELIGKYAGYDPRIDPRISNVFATAALRFGHSLIQPELQRLNENLTDIPQGPLPLRDAFFAPWRLVDEGGIDPLLRGMFLTPAKLKRPEENLNRELTEQLFRTAHAVALDLAAMNIQRSRDHAIPGYTEWRKFCNLSVPRNFDDLADDISNSRVRDKLRELYGHPGNVDVWVGGILEDQMPRSKVGPLFHCLLLEQFRRTRDGDRFWYENPSVFKPEQLEQIKRTSLASILCLNGDNITRVQKDVFLMSAGSLLPCHQIPHIDLDLWSDCCENCEAAAATTAPVTAPTDAFSDFENAIPRTRRNSDIDLSQSASLSSPEIEALVDRMDREVKNLKLQTRRLSHQILRLKRFLSTNSSSSSSSSSSSTTTRHRSNDSFFHIL